MQNLPIFQSREVTWTSQWYSACKTSSSGFSVAELPFLQPNRLPIFAFFNECVCSSNLRALRSTFSSDNWTVEGFLAFILLVSYPISFQDSRNRTTILVLLTQHICQELSGKIDCINGLKLWQMVGMIQLKLLKLKFRVCYRGAFFSGRENEVLEQTCFNCKFRLFFGVCECVGRHQPMGGVYA